MHHRPEDWFAMMCTLAGLAFAAMLTWGVVTSQRMGVPSVSMTQADNVGIRANYLVLVSLMGWGRLAADVYLFKKFDNWWVNAAALAVGLLQILFLELVSIVTLDVDVNGHYVVASIAVMLGVVRESIMLWRRAYIPQRRKPTCQETLRALALFTNLITLLLLIALIFTFGGIMAQNQHDFEALDVCFIEYSIFFVTIYLIVFQIGDFNPVKM
jgi:hypothetical protein